MPDPDSKNLTDFQVRRVEFGHPLWQKYSLADRMQKLRRDFETGEIKEVTAISTGAANHTLVKPGETIAAADAAVKTEIVSRIIFVTTDGSARTLTLPAAADFKGQLHIVHKAGAGNLVVSAAGGDDITMDGTVPELETFFSDGSNWYGGTTNERLTDVTN